MADAKESLIDQLDAEKRSVSYDAYDITLRQLVDMAAEGLINIAPDYQRHFVWKDDRESELIESLFLGIPVPSLFMATNADGSWEVVDGVQRISTIIHFCGDRKLLKMIGRKAPLEIRDLKTLSAFNGLTFDQLPKSLQVNFMLRPLRVTTLNDKSDLDVRYALFERLNTGGVQLHAQEIRSSVYRGKLNEQIKILSQYPNFRNSVIVKQGERMEALYEENVLRFFAFIDEYKKFDHLVEKFLNDYMNHNNTKGVSEAHMKVFRTTMDFIASELPNGITRGNRNLTPVNLYEAVAVGVGLAFRKNKVPKTGVLKKLIGSADLTGVTQGGTNSRAMVTRRIELVRDALV